MAKEDIGRCDCPACGGDAAVRVSSSGFAYVVCDDCVLQMFSRGPKSDACIRRRIRHGAPASAPPAVAPVRESTAQSVPEEKPAQAAAVTRRVHTSDGRTETTIFDHIGEFFK